MIYKVIELKRNWNYIQKIVLEQIETYISFEDDGYIIYSNDNRDIYKRNGKYFSKTGEGEKYEDKTMRWKEVEVTLKDSDSKNKVIMSYFTHDFLVDRAEADEIVEFYNRRNAKRREEREKIGSYIDETILEIAENLLVVAEENVLLEHRILGKCQLYYFEDAEIHTAYIRYSKKDNTFKGKEKKNIEEYNDKLVGRFSALAKIIDNFVEIIIEEKNVKEYVAKAIAWECVQRKVTNVESRI